MKKFCIALMALALTACAQSFDNIRLGMSKEDVVRIAGAPDHVISASQIDGKTVEVFEYRQGDWWWGNLDENYWFFFANNTLEKWGRPGDHLRYVE
jgi:hypothetical protein